MTWVSKITPAERRRITDILEGLPMSRFNLKMLNTYLSMMLRYKIKFEVDKDADGNDYQLIGSFEIDGENVDITLYYLKMRKKADDGANMYITGSLRRIQLT